MVSKPVGEYFQILGTTLDIRLGDLIEVFRWRQLWSQFARGIVLQDYTWTGEETNTRSVRVAEPFVVQVSPIWVRLNADNDVSSQKRGYYVQKESNLPLNKKVDTWIAKDSKQSSTKELEWGGL